jgi:farnesyl diphosphate synthase
MTQPSLSNLIEGYRLRVEKALDRFLPTVTEPPERLHAAMRDAVLGGGKRVRPLQVYLTGEALGVEPSVLDGPACAVEMIHAYSLIHDDLPAMDDDDFRRGKPTLHRAYDEATAILAGDALQVLAFSVLARPGPGPQDPTSRLAVIQCLADASGTSGMAGGQVVDIEATGNILSLEELEHMHLLKTGRLIQACVKMAALCCTGLSADVSQGLAQYGRDIGLAFQIKDDILDVVGDSLAMGKTAGSDQALEKATYPGLVGVEAAQEKAASLAASACAALEPLGSKAGRLKELAEYIVNRQR